MYRSAREVPVDLVDLTQDVTNDMPVYPGEPSTVIEPLRHGEYLSFRLTLSSHTGTSIDLPSHVSSQGKALRDYPMGRFLCRSHVIKVPWSEPDRVLNADYLAQEIHKREIGPGNGLLICTGWSQYWGTPRYFQHPFLSAEVASFIVDNNIALVGIDAPNVDDSQGSSAEVHRYLLGHDVLILENLANLDVLTSSTCTVACFPLKVPSSDGSPVRAVAWDIVKKEGG